MEREVLLGKFMFHPALSVRRALNPRLLVVQGESRDKPSIVSFYVGRKTAKKVIRSWSRLVLLQLEGALLQEGASHSHSHQMVPVARRLFASSSHPPSDPSSSPHSPSTTLPSWRLQRRSTGLCWLLLHPQPYPSPTIVPGRHLLLL
jgi:hypothetical protein